MLSINSLLNAKFYSQTRSKSGNPYNKPGPKTDINAPHNKKIREVIEQEKLKGLEHIGGGDLDELTVKTKGGAKPYRRMDASFQDPKTGKIYHHNVGLSNKKNGKPVAREVAALDDVRNRARKKNRNITFHSYGSRK